MDIVPYLGQDFNQLRRQFNSRNLFEDPRFPASSESLHRRKRVQAQWKRPHQISSNPQFILNGVEPNDISQGQVGDCWFIAAACCITTVSEYVNRVIPSGQSFNASDYCGMFHFRFWRDDRWYDVVVDDRLPVGYDDKLIYCSNKKYPNEFWCCLLEKAYAKFNICYAYLDGGLTQEGIVDLTGGLSETFMIEELTNKTQHATLWEAIKQAYKLNSLSGCGIMPKESERQEGSRPNGLIVGHAYSITKIAEINQNSKYFGVMSSNANTLFNDRICLMRLRNPWGNEMEWTGAYSDRSPEWNRISDQVKRELGLNREHDGEFWMPYQEFLKNFSTLDYCHVKMDAFVGDTIGAHVKNDQRVKWRSTSFHGSWILGKSAGGSGNEDQQKFWTNPQYVIKQEKIDDKNKIDIIVSLYVKDMLKLRESNPRNEYTGIGKQFRLYSIKEGVDIETQLNRRIRFNSSQLKRIGSSKGYSYAREISARFSLQPGYYVIIPSTLVINEQANFLLRIYSEFKINDNADLDNLNPKVDEPSAFDENFNQIEDKIFDSLKDVLFDSSSNYDLPTTIINPRKDLNDEWNQLKIDYNNDNLNNRQMGKVTFGKASRSEPQNGCIIA